MSYGCNVPDWTPAARGSYFAKHRTLTYSFVNVHNGGYLQNVDNAFDTWGKVIPIEFKKVLAEDNPNFLIGWFPDYHGDALFNTANDLAHAFYPNDDYHAGKCHFNKKTPLPPPKLHSVAIHQIGHLLGLPHNTDQNSVMNSDPNIYGKIAVLGTKDIKNIQQLYGKPGPVLEVLTHLQDIGDIKSRDNEFSGTRAQWRRLEGFQIDILRPSGLTKAQLSCEYMAHLQGTGNTTWAQEGNFIGTRGQSRRLEGFEIKLTGHQADQYEVKYIAHLEKTNNSPGYDGDTPIMAGGYCGTKGQARRVEGILVRIEKK